jgi:hypothetical protein
MEAFNMDKTIKLTVDGIELEVKISEEELAKLTKIKESKKTGYERVDKYSTFYWAEEKGTVKDYDELNNSFDDCCYETANYYSDQTLAENNARADKLMRQLRRFAAENCEEVEWGCNKYHYSIYYDYVECDFGVWYASSRREFGKICFDCMETAQKAIDTFKDELIWYFTEYRDRV